MEHPLFDQQFDERPVQKRSFSRAMFCLWAGMVTTQVGLAIEHFDVRQRSHPSPWMTALQTAGFVLLLVGALGGCVIFWKAVKADEARINARYRGWSKRAHAPCSPERQATD